MTNLIWFVLGIVFIVFALPLLQSISEIILTITEVIKAKLSLTITEYNCAMKDISNQYEDNPTRAIGYMTEDDSEDYDEEIPEDKAKNPIGFTSGDIYG